MASKKEQQRLEEIVKELDNVRKEIDEAEKQEADTAVLPEQIELLRHIVNLYKQRAKLAEEFTDIALKQP